MDSIAKHLALRNPRFACRDTSRRRELVVPVETIAGEPATAEELDRLEAIAGPAARALAPLYRLHDGLAFHVHGETAGLVVASVAELEELNAQWREWFSHLDREDLHEFQRHGFAFATIAASGNHFVIHDGKVHYSDHDGGDDAVWGWDLEEFFRRALADPARFLEDAGCYTRYADGT